MSSLAQLSPVRSLEDFSSISGYFISRLSQTEGGQFDFTLEQISYLCEIEPQHCSTLINTLDSVLDKSSHSHPGHYIREDDLEDSSIAPVSPSAGIDKNYMLPGVGSAPAGVPKYIFLLGLLPFFPAILLFAGASALALVLTISLEFLLSLILPERREVTFGKVWVGLTFIFVVPILYFTVQIISDLIISIL